MILDCGEAYLCDFPEPDVVLQLLGSDDIAVIKEKASKNKYIFTEKLNTWSMLIDTKPSMLIDTKPTNGAEWVMSLDDFENGWGERKYPHCSNCHRGVYRQDAGKWCPFCGKTMKNPMR